MNITDQFLVRIREITQQEVGLDENLLNGLIDSLSWLEVINLIEALAEQKNIKIDLEELLISKEITARKIIALLEQQK